MNAQEIRECYQAPIVEFLIQSSQDIPDYFIELGCDVCDKKNTKCPGYYPDESTVPMTYTEKLKQIRDAVLPSPETRKRKKAELDLVAVIRSFF